MASIRSQLGLHFVSFQRSIQPVNIFLHPKPPLLHQHPAIWTIPQIVTLFAPAAVLNAMVDA